MYYKPDTNEQFNSDVAIRSCFKNTSFPTEISDETLESLGVFVLYEPKDFSYDANRQKREELAPVFNEKKQQWEKQYIAVDLNEFEIAKKAAEIRQQRDDALTKSDWIVAKSFELNQSMPTEWAIYRQALRDITKQSDFPFTVVWPEKP